MNDTQFSAVNITLRNYLFAQILGHLAAAMYQNNGIHMNEQAVVDLAWKLAIAGETKLLNHIEYQSHDQS